MIKILDTVTWTIFEKTYKEFKQFYEKNMIQFYCGGYVLYG